MLGSKTSIRAQIRKKLSFEKLPSKIEFIPKDFVRRYPEDWLSLVTSARTRESLELDCVHVDRWGVLTQRGSIHPASWDYEGKGFIDRARYFWRWIKAAGQEPTIPAAVFIMPHLLFTGSYGDYWLEQLTSLAYHLPPPGSVVLFFEQQYVDFAVHDLEELGLQPMIVPKGGLNVKKLKVLEPPQFYGNFTPDVVGRLQKAFPARCTRSRIRGKKVFLSRCGYIRKGGASAIKRHLINGQQIEGYLADRGFEILRTHKFSNRQIIERLQGADVIIAEHGAAMFHLFWSPPDLLVELVAPSWFSPCFVKMTPHLPTRRHVVISAAEDGCIPLRVLGEVIASQ